MQFDKKRFAVGAGIGLGLGAVAALAGTALADKLRTGQAIGSEAQILKNKGEIASQWRELFHSMEITAAISEALQDGRLQLSIERLSTPSIITLVNNGRSLKLTVDSSYLGSVLDQHLLNPSTVNLYGSVAASAFPYVAERAAEALQHSDELQKLIRADATEFIGAKYTIDPAHR